MYVFNERLLYPFTPEELAPTTYEPILLVETLPKWGYGDPPDFVVVGGWNKAYFHGLRRNVLNAVLLETDEDLAGVSFRFPSSSNYAYTPRWWDTTMPSLLLKLFVQLKWREDLASVRYGNERSP